MKRRLFAAALAFCLILTTFSYTVLAEQDSGNANNETVVWKSSEYLNPDNPVAENNPWSVESTNNVDKTWQTVTNTSKKEKDEDGNTTEALFPTMPDGKTPNTGYITSVTKD